MKERLKAFCLRAGASRFGVADLAVFGDYKTLPAPLLNGFTRAISMAVALEDEVIEAITEWPTPQYAGHYLFINERLDCIAEAAAEWIINKGHRAEPVPASAILSEEMLRGAISHKAVARVAGVGWQGKSLLLVTPEHGPRVRLVTVLTDMPLEPDAPIENRCADCTACRDACPVGAIRGVLPKGEYYCTREEAIDLARCNARTHINAANPSIGKRICGVCVKACPWGSQ